MMQQENALSEATFAPSFEPPLNVGRVALAFIVIVGIIGLALSSSNPRIET
jgi:hypothetical protein